MSLTPPSSHTVGQTPNQPGAGLVYTQDSDPGAVGAGAVWVNTTAIAGTPCRPVSVRDSADDAWIPSGLAVYTSGVLRAFVTLASDGGIAIESLDGSSSLKGLLIMDNFGITLYSVSGALTLGGTVISANNPALFLDTVTMGALPTSDPGVTGELYTVAGVVNVSAG